MAEMDGCESRRMDYVLPFYQAPIDSDVYFHLPAGFDIYDEDENEKYYLKLKENLYGNRQAASNWFDMLKTRSEDGGLKQTKSRSMYLFEETLYCDLLSWLLLYIIKRQRDN